MRGVAVMAADLRTERLRCLRGGSCGGESLRSGVLRRGNLGFGVMVVVVVVGRVLEEEATSMLAIAGGGIGCSLSLSLFLFYF